MEGCWCCFLFQSHNVIDLLMLWKSIIYGAAVFNFVFIACELGQRFSNSFNEINDVFDQLSWYLLPIGIQRLLPITMANIQQPAVIKCFGNIFCSRNQFKKVSSINQFLLNDFIKCWNFIRWSMQHINTLWYFENFTNECLEWSVLSFTWCIESSFEICFYSLPTDISENFESNI